MQSNRKYSNDTIREMFVFENHSQFKHRSEKKTKVAPAEITQITCTLPNLGNLLHITILLGPVLDFLKSFNTAYAALYIHIYCILDEFIFES